MAKAKKDLIIEVEGWEGDCPFRYIDYEGYNDEHCTLLDGGECIDMRKCKLKRYKRVIVKLAKKKG
jgi:hypothetical protein